MGRQNEVKRLRIGQKRLFFPQEDWHNPRGWNFSPNGSVNVVRDCIRNESRSWAENARLPLKFERSSGNA
jgi:hypothetical protein